MYPRTFEDLKMHTRAAQYFINERIKDAICKGVPHFNTSTNCGERKCANIYKNCLERLKEDYNLKMHIPKPTCGSSHDAWVYRKLLDSLKCKNIQNKLIVPRQCDNQQKKIKTLFDIKKEDKYKSKLIIYFVYFLLFMILSYMLFNLSNTVDTDKYLITKYLYTKSNKLFIK